MMMIENAEYKIREGRVRKEEIYTLERMMMKTGLKRTSLLNFIFFLCISEFKKWRDGPFQRKSVQPNRL